MSSDLTEYEHRMLRDQTTLGAAFRAGANAEARMRESATLVHRDLIDYVRALAEHHPECSTEDLAVMVARVFAPSRIRVRA